MSVIEWNKSFLTPDTATYRAWIAGFHANLAALGLVRLTEGSPIDPATVNRPVGVDNNSDPATNQSTVAGSDIWRFNDALQGTKPVFIKWYYSVHGYNPFSYGFPADDASYGRSAKIRLWFEVGQGTDGAGNLTSPKTPLREISTAFLTQNTAPTGVFYAATQGEFETYKQHLFSGSSSRLSIMFGANAPADYGLDYNFVNASMFGTGYSEQRLSPMLNIERSHDPLTGADTGDGISILHQGFTFGNDNNIGAYNLYHKNYPKMEIYFPFGQAPQVKFFEFSSLANLASNRTLNSRKKKYYGLPIINHDFGDPVSPVLGMLGSMNFDFTIGINQVKIFGTERNYRKPDNRIRSSQGTQNRDSWLMILWE